MTNVKIPAESILNSSCKLDTSADWNFFQPKFATELKQDSRVKFVNLRGEQFWRNNAETAVVRVDFTNVAEALAFAALWAKRADEFDFAQLENTSVFVFRLWWD